MTKRYSRQELWEQQEDIAKNLGLHKRSITPDTLKEIIFQNSEEDPYYGELYKYKNNEVVRYGLNTSSQELLKIAKDYNANVKGALDTKSLTSIASEKNLSKNIDTIKNHKINSANIITKAEFINTNNAIQCLKNGAKTVLVDIFDRDSDGKIKIESNIPETHTVVLYEKSGKYLVIDPSNATFSYLLAGVHEDVRLCFSNKLQIYKAGGKTGAKSDEWRDCIDIAVKLAFSVNNNEKLGLENKLIATELEENKKPLGFGYIDLESIKSSSSVKEITNQNSLYKKLPEMVEKYAIRIKQSSDTIHVKKVTTWLKSIDHALSKTYQKLDELDLYNYKAKIGKMFVDIFKITSSPVEYEDTIKKFEECYHHLQDINNMDETKLLGMEIQSIEEGII